MSKSTSVWQSIKNCLPLRVLNLARFIYSPAHRLGRRESAKLARIAGLVKPLLTATHGSVASGPFRDMKYISRSTGSALAPKILGTYEIELHGVVEDILSRNPSCLIDIGAAEGYYAVGFALRVPHCRVIAYEATEDGRSMLRELATLNGVADRIEIRGYCDQDNLESTLQNAPDDSLVICDTEGGELSLMDPAIHPKLSRLNLLIEIHHWIRPDMRQLIESRFRNSGTLSTTVGQERTDADFPSGLNATFNREERLLSMDELRPPAMEWVRLIPTPSQNP